MDSLQKAAEDLLGLIPQTPKGLAKHIGTVIAINADGTLSVRPDGSTTNVTCFRTCNPKVGSRVIILIDNTQWIAIGTIGGDTLNRTVITDLTSNKAATDTGQNITVGVTGILPIANGGKLKNYSTSEQLTGEYWVDGNAIYRKTVLYGSKTAGGFTAVNHGITGISKVLRCWGTCDQGMIGANFNDATNETLYSSNIWASKTQITVSSGTQNGTYTNIYATVEYTKTMADSQTVETTSSKDPETGEEIIEEIPNPYLPQIDLSGAENS